MKDKYFMYLLYLFITFLYFFHIGSHYVGLMCNRVYKTLLKSAKLRRILVLNYWIYKFKKNLIINYYGIKKAGRKSFKKKAVIAEWYDRWTAKSKVAGSNPGTHQCLLEFMCVL